MYLFLEENEVGVKQGFRSLEVAKLTGLTQRQIDYWDRTGLFCPTLAQAEGRGSARFYSFLDVVQLKIVKRLLDAGLSTKRLRECLRFLKENLKETNLNGHSLVSDGKGLFLLTDNPTFAVDLTRQGQVAWLVNMELAAKEIINSYEVNKLTQKRIVNSI